MNVAFVGYREWANIIFYSLTEALLREDRQWTFSDIQNADVILYYGWSDIIPKERYLDKLCLILHPSPLPKYRGGSPLQHQIIAGETMSAVTICKVTEQLDSGDIYAQVPFSLAGSLDSIFDRIITIGITETVRILDELAAGTACPVKQDENQATYFKRRTPEESELKLKDFESKSSEELYNFIRALSDPYPNAFIRCKDGKKLYFTGVHV